MTKRTKTPIEQPTILTLSLYPEEVQTILDLHQTEEANAADEGDYIKAHYHQTRYVSIKQAIKGETPCSVLTHN